MPSKIRVVLPVSNEVGLQFPREFADGNVKEHAVFLLAGNGSGELPTMSLTGQKVTCNAMT